MQTTPNFTRRRFLGAAATVVASASAFSTPSAVAQEDSATPATAVDPESSGAGLFTKLYKGQICKEPTDAICEKLTDAGFEGMEVTNWNVDLAAARQSRLLAEKHHLRIHSVMRAWTNVNQDDKFDADVASVVTALESASAYGADTVLWVPCRVGGAKMPEAWDFDVDFDPKTLMVKSVTTDDNAAFADYIAAQNLATEKTLKAIEALIPTAAKVGVRIGLENVWNNLWCTPKFFAALCKYFDNPWVGAYFDLGNHTKYSRCEEWLKELGHCIVKLHIKGYKISEEKGKLGGGLV